MPDDVKIHVVVVVYESANYIVFPVVSENHMGRFLLRRGKAALSAVGLFVQDTL